MSDDEGVVLLFSLGLVGFTFRFWLLPCFSVRQLARGGPPRGLILAWPLFCLAVLYSILRAAAASDVRDSGLYMAFYLVLGAAWLGLGHRVLEGVQLSLRDDVLERANPAAAWAVLGGQLGLTLAYAGANIGDGPGWWVVVYCAGLSSGGLLLLWWVLDWVTRIGFHISVDRDLASGQRAFALLVGGGLILGRAAAGDWRGAGPAAWDFLFTCAPALALFALGALLQWMFQPRVALPRPPWWATGLPPALLLLALAALAVQWAGPW